MTEFKVELADVPIGIRCRHEVNKTFLRKYLTEKTPLFSIEPTDADLRRSQEEFEILDETSGREKTIRPDSFLENIAIHRLLAERLTEYDDRAFGGRGET